MKAATAANWMLARLSQDGCIYQDDVVDELVRANAENLLRENNDGNMVVGADLLKVFKKLTETTVVWVKPDRYWRFRVPEDDIGRDASG